MGLSDFAYTDDIKTYLDEIIKSAKNYCGIVVRKDLLKFSKYVYAAAGNIVDNYGKSDHELDCVYSVYGYMVKKLSPYMLNLNTWTKSYTSYFEKYLITGGQKCASFDTVLNFLRDMSNGDFVKLEWNNYEKVAKVLQKYKFDLD
jgi:hypothetical protein